MLCVSVCSDLIKGAKEKSLKVKGPVRMPTKVNKINDNFFAGSDILNILSHKGDKKVSKYSEI